MTYCKEIILRSQPSYQPQHSNNKRQLFLCIFDCGRDVVINKKHPTCSWRYQNLQTNNCSLDVRLFFSLCSNQNCFSAMIQLVSARWGVSHVFSLLSTRRSLTHEQCLRLKSDGRPCPKIFLKDRASDSVYAAFPWICGDEEKNTYFCWPCLVMGDLDKVSSYY